MKKIKYYYNTHTLRYEKLVTPLRVKLLRVFGFISAAIVTAMIIVSIAYRYLDSPKEKEMRRQITEMEDRYKELYSAMKELQQRTAQLESRDNNIYRTIFEASPIPDSVREKKMMHAREITLVSSMSDNELISSISEIINNVSRRLAFQNKSFDDIEKMIANKEQLLKATPAIQPVSNKDLERVASGFGVRIDPVYKTPRFHKGLDFTAPQGTPIYATADGVVEEAGFSTGGYGNNVIINHGYGYKTLYGHMYRVKVRAGQRVKRGETIGWVGNTGKSTGPHCHYEVHKNGNPVDPVYFFYNDLTPAQYERMLKLASSKNQSFD
jgi:murein DD-endopeptidase MepM/ murein hydrolase activator NlpD